MDKKKLSELVAEFQISGIFSEQDFFLNGIENCLEDPPENFITACEKLCEIRTFKENYLEKFNFQRIFRTHRAFLNQSKLFAFFGLETPEIVEIIGDSGQGKSLLIKRMIDTLPGDYVCFLINNKINLTTYFKKDLIKKTVLDIQDLSLCLAKLSKLISAQNIKFPVIFIDDFSVLLYDLESFSSYTLRLIDLVSILRKIRDELLGTIIVTGLPKKSFKRGNYLGSIIPSPWRCIANRQIYVSMDKKSLNSQVVNCLTGKQLFLEMDFSDQ